MSRFLRSFASVLCLLALAACGSEEATEDDFVARLGDVYLLETEVETALASMPPGLDSQLVRQQYIEQWMTNELLAQEALKQELMDDPDVQRQVRESQRSILITELVSRLQETAQSPSELEIQAYFDANVNNLRLREPFARLRYLSTADSASAVAAREMLLTLGRRSNPDSLWQAEVIAQASDSEGAMVLSTNYFPMSRLFRAQPELAQTLRRIGPGEVAPLVKSGDLFHVFQLAERAPTGTAPQLDWVREEVRQHLMISARRQMYIDKVQRLRTEALAAGQLVLPDDSL
ncbi:MAG: peptidyl-prolyl cis-trans isomerase [Bacteroidota bacterium]